MSTNDRSVTAFRERHGLSRTLYYSLKQQGRAPRETYLTPHKIIITPKDEAAWLAARAKPHGTEARLIAAAAEARRARARHAARISVASPRHVSKRGGGSASASATAKTWATSPRGRHPRMHAHARKGASGAAA
jgi:hypothetical protein